MVGLVPTIHVFLRRCSTVFKTWLLATRASMTTGFTRTRLRPPAFPRSVEMRGSGAPRGAVWYRAASVEPGCGADGL